MYGGYLPEELQSAQSFGRALIIPYGIVGVAGGYTLTMMYPLETMVGVGFLDNAYMSGTAPANMTEFFGFVLNFFGITKGVK